MSDADHFVLLFQVINASEPFFFCVQFSEGHKEERAEMGLQAGQSAGDLGWGGMGRRDVGRLLWVGFFNRFAMINVYPSPGSRLIGFRTQQKGEGSISLWRDVENWLALLSLSFPPFYFFFFRVSRSRPSWDFALCD